MDDKYPSDKMEEKIERALFQLLKVQDFNSVSVSQIAKEANVSRTSYYRYFYSKDEIIDRYIQNLIDDIHDDLRYPVDSEVFWKKMLSFAAENRDPLCLIAKNGLAFYILSRINERVLKNAGSGGEKMQNVFPVIGLVGEVFNIVMFWLLNSPEVEKEDVIRQLTEIASMHREISQR